MTLAPLVASVLVILQWSLPRRFALLPLMLAAVHCPDIVIFEPGFSFVRLVIAAGMLRAVVQREAGLRGPADSLDVAVGIMAVLLVASGWAHGGAEGTPIVLRIGMAGDLVGTYVLARCYLRGSADLLRAVQCLALVLVPLAVLMFAEKTTGHNAYEILGATFSMVRHGEVRAAGPFGNAILAGTFAATLVPLILALRARPALRAAGLAACALVLFSASSTGPYLALFAGLGALALWRVRRNLAVLRGLAIVSVVALHLVMQDPVWYLSARIDLGGGSTGYHRAELITQALAHLDEWWLAGTDYTRHWLPYGVPWSARHADITNHYLKLGVVGGLPLMAAFVGVLALAFRRLGRAMRAMRAAQNPDEPMLWALGAALFAHCVALLGVAYFDQSHVFLVMLVGAARNLGRVSQTETREQSRQPPDRVRASRPRRAGTSPVSPGRRALR